MRILVAPIHQMRTLHLPGDYSRFLMLGLGVTRVLLLSGFMKTTSTYVHLESGFGGLTSRVAGL